MYLVQIDTEGEIAKIGKQLGSLHDKAPNVLASAERTNLKTLFHTAEQQSNISTPPSSSLQRFSTSVTSRYRQPPHQIATTVPPKRRS